MSWAKGSNTLLFKREHNLDALASVTLIYMEICPRTDLIKVMMQKYLSISNHITQWIILLDCFGIFIWRLTSKIRKSFTNS